MDVLATSDITIVFCLFCLAGLVFLFAVVLIVVWVWMLNDWNKRAKSDPATHERYKIQMIIGWPFGYYLNVYRKNGPVSY
jgi:hypothetical protein